MGLRDRIVADGRKVGASCPEPTVEQMRQVGQALRPAADRRKAAA